MIIIGQECWNLLHGKNSLPNGYRLLYRLTQFCEWQSATFSWCILRCYYYEEGKNTGKTSYEICVGVDFGSRTYEKNRPCFLWEQNKFDFNRIGLEYIDFGNNI